MAWFSSYLRVKKWNNWPVKIKWKFSAFLFLFLLVLTVCFLAYLSSWLYDTAILPPTPSSNGAWPVIAGLSVEQVESRPLVNRQLILDCLTNGQWVGGHHTESQAEEIRIFLRKTRDQYRLPNPLQREDNRCVDLNFGESLKWFRAVCDPHGLTPCCDHGFCQSSPTENCTCHDCYDLRQRLDAELSQWQNVNPQCQVKTYTREEACDILGNRTIRFIGDSHIRHMYMGLLIILTDNAVDGCMRKNMSKDLRSTCLGLYMFSEKVCRKYIKFSQTLCDGRVRIRLKYLYGNVATPIMKYVSGKIEQPNSLFVIGIGHHDSFNSTLVISDVTSPLLYMVRKSGIVNSSTDLLWVGVHSLGLLKTPTVLNQQNENVITFNRDMRAFLLSEDVAFMDSFNLTKGLSSPDGSHYGMGANLLKAQVVLNYLSKVKKPLRL